MARTKTKRTEAKKEEVGRLFAERLSLSLRQAAPNAAISMSTLHRILKCDLKHKFYHTISVQRLQETHKEQRRQFCQWLLDQDEDLVKRVIWTRDLLWGSSAEAQRKVYTEKPQSIQDLIKCVEMFAVNYDPTIIDKVTKNVLKRARLCLEEAGGHFQHLL